MIVVSIMAKDLNGAIGLCNKLPWGNKFPTDLKFFKSVTTLSEDTLLICGMKTYSGLPALPNRNAAVITRSVDEPERVSHNCTLHPSIYSALDAKPKLAIIIGGAEIYKLAAPFIDVRLTTTIHDTFFADTYHPTYQEDAFTLVRRKVFFNADDTGTKMEICASVRAKDEGIRVRYKGLDNLLNLVNRA